MGDATEWEGLLVTWLPSGGLSLTDLSVSEQPFASIAVTFDDPWTRGTRCADDEECDEQWATSGVVATVNWRVYSAFRFTVDLPESPAAGPVLEVESTSPCQSWLAGSHGFVLLDPGRPDGRLLALVQERGDGQFSSGRRFLFRQAATRPTRLSWACEWIEHPRQLTDRIPPWWPRRTTFESGDELVLELPDAAIEAAGVQVTDRGDDARAIAGRDGPHIASVHEGSGTTLVHLWWAPPLASELARRAQTAMSFDPRLAPAHAAWIVSRASKQGTETWLDAACDELVGGEPSAFAAAVLADHAMRRGDDDLLQAAIDRLPTDDGRELAWIHVALACQIMGRDVPSAQVTLPVAAHNHTVPPEEFWRRLTVLGRGLPGEVGTHLEIARAVALASLAPEQWDFSGWWMTPLSILVEDATRRLLAERCSDDVFAWLLW